MVMTEVVLKRLGLLMTGEIAAIEKAVIDSF